jgi:lipoprotein-anchoring transpeptidase ErfK/SrfK
MVCLVAKVICNLKINYRILKNLEIMAKKIKIDILKQKLTALDGKSVFMNVSCVTGDDTHPTPTGKFKIIKKDRIHLSKKYNAQMNFALQLTNDGIFIHESYNYISNPNNQTQLATTISDTTTNVVSQVRSWIPNVSKVNVNLGMINIIGSHGCIRLAHTDAVQLFTWADLATEVDIK